MNENIFKNRRILVKRQEDGKVIADTRILRYEWQSSTFYIAASSLMEKKNAQVTALVFGSDNLYEFEGAIRGSAIGNEVAVYAGKPHAKEDRAKQRYAMAAKGVVISMYFLGQEVQLNRPMVLETVNISASGILIRMDSGSFETGNSFRMVIPIEGRKLEFTCEVVRVQNDNRLTEEYGCRITGTHMRTQAAKKA